MFTYILPTIFATDRLEKQLAKVLESDLVDEVILVINSEEDLLSIKHKKLLKIIPNEPQYCNGAWNLGACISATEYIILATDDIEYDINIFSLIKEKLDNHNTGIIGCEYQNLENDIKSLDSTKIIYNSHKSRPYCFGQLMCMRRENFILIPEGIKHWYGDDWLFHYNILSGRVNYSISGDFWMRSKISESSAGSNTQTRIQEDTKWWHANANVYMNMALGIR